MKKLLIVLVILLFSIGGCSTDDEIKTDTDASSEIETSEEPHAVTEEPAPLKEAEEETILKPEQIPELPKEAEEDTIPEPEQTPELPKEAEEDTIPELEKSPEPSGNPEELISQTKEYTGEDRGIGGPIIVSVTIKDDKITQIEVVSHNETKGVSENAIDTIISSIIKNQTTDVDAVSGATVTSRALMNAVKNAVEKEE